MFDFEPTEEQRALIDVARRFARERIIPIAAECDRDREVSAVTSSRRRTRFGLVNPTLPAEYGGAGLSDVDDRSSPRSSRTAAPASRRA
jgi:acyl-CoA dehydrogenase